MLRRPRFDLVFAPESIAHLGAIERKYHRLIRKAIDGPLRHMPERIKRNRTRNGKAVAVLLAPVSDDDLEMLLFARSPRFQSVLDKSRLSIRVGKRLSAQAFWKAVAEQHKNEKAPDRVRRKSTEKR